MTATKQPGIAHYTGNVRLWQTANVVRAPNIDFDNEKRSIVAESESSQTVSSLFVQQSQDGKLTPVDVTSDKLTYVDEERRARYTGNVLARTPTGTISAAQIDVFLKPADPDARKRQAAAQPHRKRHRFLAPTGRARSITWSPSGRWW